MRDVQRDERYICYVAQGGWVSKGSVDNIDITSNFAVVVVLLSATDQVMYITRSLLTFLHFFAFAFTYVYAYYICTYIFIHGCIIVIFMLVSESVMVCQRESKCVEEGERESKNLKKVKMGKIR